MGIVLYSTLLTLLDIGAVRSSESLGLFNDQLIKIDDSQDLEAGNQNLYADDTLTELLLQSLRQLKRQIQSQSVLLSETEECESIPLQLISKEVNIEQRPGPVILLTSEVSEPDLKSQSPSQSESIPLQLIRRELNIEKMPEPVIVLPSEPQPETTPQYLLVPSPNELGCRLSADYSSQLQKLLQPQLNRRLWIIRIRIRRTPRYLVVVIPKRNFTPDGLAIPPLAQEESNQQILAEDRLIQTRSILLQIQSLLQNLIISNLAQSRGLQNITAGSSAQSLQAPPLPQKQTVNSPTKSPGTLSSSGSPSLDSSTKSPNDLSLSPTQDIGLDISTQSPTNLSQLESPNQTLNSSAQSPKALSQSESKSQSQNHTLNSSAQSRDALSQLKSQSQSQNQTLNISELSLDTLSQLKSQSQSQNQTLNSSAQSRDALSQLNSQSQSQNQTSNISELSRDTLSQLKSQSQSQNQTMNNSVQSRDALSQLNSQSKSQNQTVNSSAQSWKVLSQLATQSESQNETMNKSVQARDAPSHLNAQSKSQNQTMYNSGQLLDALSRINSKSKSQNQTLNISELSRDTLSQLKSQSQFQTMNNSGQSRDYLSQLNSQFKLQKPTLNSAQPRDVPSQLGSQSQSQNKTVSSSGQSLDNHTVLQSQSQNQSTNSSVDKALSESKSQTLSSNLTLNASDHLNEFSTHLKIVSQFTSHQQVADLATAANTGPDIPPHIYTLSDIQDDSRLETMDLIQKYGYPSETRFAYTEDGYKLCLHRIPRPGAPPVLLVHGLMSSSASWVQFGPSNGLAYILYRKGYDVWMLNTRGNIYSREHTMKRINPRMYWDFSFHEIGKYDLPPSIDLILQITNQPRVQYIGHSQGSTVFFVMCSERPDYASKVNLMQALAPTVYLQNNRSPVLKFLGMFKGKFSMLVNLLGGYQISSSTKLIQQFRQHICSTSELASRICAIFDFVLCGFDWKSFNESFTPIVASHASQGASAKLIYHYAQMQADLSFKHFDHGRLLNRVRYENYMPPQYNLSLTANKVVLHHSGGDWLGSDTDVGHLQQSLPNIVETRKVAYESFAHFDFTISKNVRSLVYDSVLGHLHAHRHF